ncbi:MAG: pyruvate ferredoxin oxidoreductase [Planctomycetes bacterium]|nr:pyruvate ferredoxin oxidoreductase [Planctomycetota bacterium]
MAQTIALTGNDAAATALKQVNPDVAAVYPITPQTEMMHKFAEFVADGDVDTEMVLVESEHSAMSACVGSAAAGARTITATSANGLALMWEILYIAASYRLPIIMPEASRALSGPINIHCDHSDSMGARDTGWIVLFSESAQEAYDNIIQAFRIGENHDILLPVMVTLDGFILSHTVEALSLLEDRQVKDFVGEYKPHRMLLDVDNPMTIGPLDLQNYYFEHKRQQVEAMKNALDVIPEVGKAFGELSGREYGYMECIDMDDAEVALIGMGSTMGTVKQVVREMREEGQKVGAVKLRVFRPFPAQQIIDAVKHVKVLGVLDRSVSFGLGGPLFHEIKSAAYSQAEIGLKNFMYGLGGRDISLVAIRTLYEDLLARKDAGTTVHPEEYVGVRE